MNPQQYHSETDDLFIYAVTYFRKFPAEDAMTATVAVQELTERVRHEREHARSDHVRERLELCLRQLECAGDLAISDVQAAHRHVQLAHSCFESADQPPTRPTRTFVAGAQGNVIVESDD